MLRATMKIPSSTLKKVPATLADSPLRKPISVSAANSKRYIINDHYEFDQKVSISAVKREICWYEWDVALITVRCTTIDKWNKWLLIGRCNVCFTQEKWRENACKVCQVDRLSICVSFFCNMRNCRSHACCPSEYDIISYAHLMVCTHSTHK